MFKMLNNNKLRIFQISFYDLAPGLLIVIRLN
jgi:hypothetical protein